jgi:glycosyltransferase involved in cell wall biosynthesis
MPIYNGENFVHRAMESILNQTYQNFIVVIIDDGCTDNTAAICEGYAARDNRVRVYHNEENLGVARSLNRGMDLCEGDYIARADVDDINHPERLAKQVVYMEAHQDVGVLGSFCREFGKYEKIVKLPVGIDNVRSRLIFFVSLYHPTVLLRRKLFEKNKWRYPVRTVEDFSLFTALMHKTNLDNLLDVLVDRFIGETNVTTTKSKAISDDASKIIRETITRDFSVDTSRYSYKHFAPHNAYPTIWPYETERILCEAAALFREMSSANKKFRRFDDKSLREILASRWEIAKSATLLSDFLIDVPFDVSALPFHKIIAEAMLKYKTITESDPKVVVYAVGD